MKQLLTTLFALATVAPASAETFTLDFENVARSCVKADYPSLQDAVLEMSSTEGCVATEGALPNGAVVTTVCSDTQQILFEAETDCEAFRAFAATKK